MQYFFILESLNLYVIALNSNGVTQKPWNKRSRFVCFIFEIQSTVKFTYKPSIQLASCFKYVQR
jgi:hypothetical protein